MINKNLKIALFSFAALFILSMIYLVFAFIFKIWPFYNEDFSSPASQTNTNSVCDKSPILTTLPLLLLDENIPYDLYMFFINVVITKYLRLNNCSKPKPSSIHIFIAIKNKRT